MDDLEVPLFQETESPWSTQVIQVMSVDLATSGASPCALCLVLWVGQRNPATFGSYWDSYETR